MTDAEKIAELKALCWLAYRELNAVRARDGVPRDWRGDKVGVSEEWWSILTDALSEAAGTSKPWPEDFMAKTIDTLNAKLGAELES
jgi:hypothetical protein